MRGETDGTARLRQSSTRRRRSFRSRAALNADEGQPLGAAPQTGLDCAVHVGDEDEGDHSLPRDGPTVTSHDNSPEPYSSIVLLIGGTAFILGMQYAPAGWIWGALGLIVFPFLVGGIAKMVLERMTWTPWRVFRAKRWVGGAFVAFCVWQAMLSARQTSHVECTQETGGRDSECVEWTRVPGGDDKGVLMFMALGGFVLWRLAQLQEPTRSKLARPLPKPDDPDRH